MTNESQGCRCGLVQMDMITKLCEMQIAQD